MATLILPPSASLQAYTIIYPSPPTIGNYVWCPYSEATRHVTSNLANLLMYSKYNSPDKLAMEQV